MEIQEIETSLGIFVAIENEDGSVTSMPKEIWEQLEAQREQREKL